MNFAHWFLTVLCPRGSFRGAYDAFVASIVHAYEPARRVLTTYTGSLVRLRRSSDNAEADFGYLANGDLDVAAIAAWAGGASYVVTVYDQAAAGDDVTQAVVLDQPPYVAAAQNGHAGMRFDGTDDFLQGAFTTGGVLSQPYNIFAAGQLDATAVNDDANHLLTQGDDIAHRSWLGATKITDPDCWRIYAGQSLEGSATHPNWAIWASLFNGVSSQFWGNGTSQAAGDAGTENLDGLTMGAKWDGDDRWKGLIVSVVICDPSLSDAQRVAMENAMNAYWSCY